MCCVSGCIIACLVTVCTMPPSTVNKYDHDVAIGKTHVSERSQCHTAKGLQTVPAMKIQLLMSLSRKANDY